MTETNYLFSHTGMMIASIIDNLVATHTWSVPAKVVEFDPHTAEKIARLMCGIVGEEMRPEYFI